MPICLKVQASVYCWGVVGTLCMSLAEDRQECSNVRKVNLKPSIVLFFETFLLALGLQLGRHCTSLDAFCRWIADRVFILPHPYSVLLRHPASRLSLFSISQREYQLQ